MRDPRDREHETLEGVAAALDRMVLAGRFTDKHELLAVICAITTVRHHGAYEPKVAEATLQLACEMYGFHPDENQPPEVDAMEDHEIILEALRRLKE